MNWRRHLGSAAVLAGVAPTASTHSTDIDSETEAQECTKSFSTRRTTVVQIEAMDTHLRTIAVNLSNHCECSVLILSTDLGSYVDDGSSTRLNPAVTNR